MFILLASRFLAQAVFVPPYEGPDEPFHLARVLAFFDSPWSEAWAGDSVPARVVSSVRELPCGPDLARAFGCPPFSEGRSGSTASTTLPDATPYPNYEAHQPPLYYLAGAGALWAGSPLARMLGLDPLRPIVALRSLRLLGVLLATGGTYLVLFVVGRDWSPEARLLSGAFLLFPGASESLVRAANDVGVFGWSAAVMALAARERLSSWRLGLACLLGPLVKLTALPIVALAVASSWRRGERRSALAAGLLGLGFLPVQWARGFDWGGTVELNASASHALPGPVATVVGMAESVAVTVKTAFWLGGWSFFRAPAWLMPLTLAAVLLAVTKNRVRLRLPSGALAHAAALAVAAAGVVHFCRKHFEYFGVWGGVGGWYFWGWAPWIAVLARESLSFEKEAGERTAFRAALLSAVLWNIVWFTRAWALYYGHE